MAKYKVPKHLQNDYRRMVQLANRRIVTTANTYENAGKTTLPINVVGKEELQDRSTWHTPKMPIDRGIVFESEADFKRKLRFLQSFDPKAPGQTKPTLTEYTTIQRSKTAMAMTKSLGIDVPTSILEQINLLSAPQLSEFWSRFSKKSTNLGLRYSSLQAMQEVLNEMFPEDVKQFIGMASDLVPKAG